MTRLTFVGGGQLRSLFVFLSSLLFSAYILCFCRNRHPRFSFPLLLHFLRSLYFFFIQLFFLQTLCEADRVTIDQRSADNTHFCLQSLALSSVWINLQVWSVTITPTLAVFGPTMSILICEIVVDSRTQARKSKVLRLEDNKKREGKSEREATLGLTKLLTNTTIGSHSQSLSLTSYSNIECSMLLLSLHTLSLSCLTSQDGLPSFSHTHCDSLWVLNSVLYCVVWLYSYFLYYEAINELYVCCGRERKKNNTFTWLKNVPYMPFVQLGM